MLCLMERKRQQMDILHRLSHRILHRSYICFDLSGTDAWIVFCGVEKGIEKFSRIIMPGLILLILVIAVFR